MIGKVCQIIGIIFFAMMISVTISCTGNKKNQETDNTTIDEENTTDEKNITINEEDVDSDQEVEETEYSIIDNHHGGLINDNGIRIRSNPNANAKILGILNTDDYVSILAVTNERQDIDYSRDYWYKIRTSENITGWIFGKYIYFLKPDEPLEFANNKWYRYFGELAPKENISLADIQSCSWHTGYTYLTFSKEGNYAVGERWTGPSYGVYELHDNVVSFNPPFQYFINSIKYQIDKLYYSNEMHYIGAPVLKNRDENLEFYPHGHMRSKLGETVRVDGHYCEKISEETQLNKNNVLYALPDISSINVFKDDYYGNKSMEAETVKLAKTKIDDIVWYYIGLDFTTEPMDGGGPRYYGWLPEEYFE